jgi:hypothetical protein
MATPSQMTKLVAEVKKNPGESERYYSEKCGIDMALIGRSLWAAEVQADPSLKIAATPASVAKAADKGTLRWPRIAAYAGISVGQSKALYEQHTGKAAPSNLTSRGRQFDGVTPQKRTGSSGRRGAAAAKPSGTSGRRGAAKPTTAKRGAAKPAAGKPAGRRGTRAGADPK